MNHTRRYAGTITLPPARRPNGWRSIVTNPTDPTDEERVGPLRLTIVSDFI